jgi:hypothetical protein
VIFERRGLTGAAASADTRLLLPKNTSGDASNNRRQQARESRVFCDENTPRVQCSIFSPDERY